MKIAYPLLVSIILLVQCAPKKASEEMANQVDSSKVAMINPAASLKMLKIQCYSCHNPEFPGGQRIAPSISDIQRSYKDFYLTRQEFVDGMVAFVNKPSIEGSKMTDAIDQYNLMPVLGFSEEDVANIAGFLFEASGKVADWEEPSNDEENIILDPIETGRQMALSTKTQLGKNLLGAIKSRGTDGALSFCNIKAMPLTDSMSQVHGALIKRVSDRPRNPLNQANAIELRHIASFKERIQKGQKVVPILQEQGDSINFYMPIMTNNMCLQCHGQVGTQVKPVTLTQLDELYPEDQARGYAENQVRGIWSISWLKDQD
jgi:cytochrome c553